MSSAEEVFERLSFDVEHFTVASPYEYRRFLGFHPTVQLHPCYDSKFVGYTEYFPKNLRHLCRNPVSLSVEREQQVRSVMPMGHSYLHHFRNPHRVSFLVPGVQGWSEYEAILPENDNQLEKLEARYREEMALHPRAFNAFSSLRFQVAIDFIY